MRNVSKLCLCCIGILSFSACDKGSKVSREKFIEKAKTIEKENNFATATLDCKQTIFDGRETTEPINKTVHLKKNSTNEWEITDLEKDEAMEEITSQIFTKLNLTRRISGGFYETEYEDEKFYIKPFGYEHTTKSDFLYKDEKWYNSNYVYYEWNDFGYITRYESEEKTAPSDGRYIYSDKIEITIEFK